MHPTIDINRDMTTKKSKNIPKEMSTTLLQRTNTTAEYSLVNSWTISIFILLVNGIMGFICIIIMFVKMLTRGSNKNAETKVDNGEQKFMGPIYEEGYAIITH